MDFAAGSGPSSLAIVDLNQDGSLDLATVNSTSNMVVILLGNGDGTFGSPASYGAGYNPIAVAAGDLLTATGIRIWP